MPELAQPVYQLRITAGWRWSPLFSSCEAKPLITNQSPGQECPKICEAWNAYSVAMGS